MARRRGGRGRLNTVRPHRMQRTTMAQGQLNEASETGSGFYVRQATGLVREIGLTSNVIINISAMSIPLALLVATQGTYAFPGANLPLVVVITVVFCII